MKKITYSLYILAAVFLLSSCSWLSTLSITKRHYSKGYHIDMVAKHKTEAIKQAITSETSSVKQSAPGNNIFETTAQHPTANGRTVAKPANELTSSKEIIASIVKPAGANKFSNLVPNTLEELKNINATGKVYVSESKARDSNSHGLLWTIIVILLVLWLLSLLTGGWGLGGLLHLLLVIALILIILTLLNVI